MPSAHGMCGSPTLSHFDHIQHASGLGSVPDLTILAEDESADERQHR
jgi:hypothetical protein